jgi:hypothetical protein
MNEEHKNYKSFVALIIGLLAVIVIVLIFAKARNTDISGSANEFAEISVPAASEFEPLTLASENLNGKSRSIIYQKVSVYNKFDTAEITPSITCNDEEFTSTSDTQTIIKGQQKEFLIKINTGKVSVGEYICTLNVKGINISGKDFIIRIL